MMRNRHGPRCAPKLRLLPAAVLVAALLGACSDGQRPAPAQFAEFPTPSRLNFSTSDPAVAWSERLCRAVLPVARAGSPPSLDAHDLDGSRKRFHTYLHDHVNALNAALTDIAAAGPAPVDNGPQADQVLVTTLSTLRDALAAGAAELDAVPPNLRDTLLYTLTGVSSLLVPTDGSTLLDLVRPISLQPAIRQAPSCQTVAASAGTPDTPAPPTPIR
jgi:hypothetical protein